MKTFTQVILPIVCLAGLVFGITFLTNYSGTTPTPVGTPTAAPKALKFAETIGQRTSSPERGRSPDQKPESAHLPWHDNFEVGEQGHFDFIFQNDNLQDVRLSFVSANCQCAGAEVGVIPPDAWNDYLHTFEVLATSSAAASPATLSMFVNAESRLDTSITWTKMEKGGETTVPAAEAEGRPQFGIVRLNWTGKEPESKRTVSGNFVAQLPGANAEPITLEARFKVVPPFDVWSPSGGRGVRLRDLSSGNSVTEDLVIWSRTRPSLQVALSADAFGNNKDCITLSPPKRVPDQDLPQLARAIGGSDALELQCAYRSTITVREHKEENGKVVKRLDVGPIDFPLVVAVAEAKAINVPVTGMVRGEVRVIDGGQADRINFGAAFSSSARSSKQVTLESERPGLEVELGKSTPDYLQVALEPNPEQNGKKSWSLKVTIPAGKLFGNLSEGFVVLQTKELPKRLIRIPIKAMSYSDSGARP